MIRYIFGFFLMGMLLAASTEEGKEAKLDQALSEVKAPLYTPLLERYFLDNIRDLHAQMEGLRAEMHEKIADKELTVANKAMDYATSTVGNMFYIVAAATSILVILGWTSLKDLREKIQEQVNDQIATVIKKNEEKIAVLERNLSERSNQVLKNQEAIARTNTIHSLWMRAGLETNPQTKMEIYDQILALRDNKDAEALSYKAEAALDLEEANWALNLANEALKIDEEYPNAYYQRACAYQALGYSDNAVDDIKRALELNEHYIDDIVMDKSLEGLRENENFKALVKRYEGERDETS